MADTRQRAGKGRKLASVAGSERRLTQRTWVLRRVAYSIVFHQSLADLELPLVDGAGAGELEPDTVVSRQVVRVPGRRMALKVVG
jgi:hypothetical protein